MQAAFQATRVQSAGGLPDRVEAAQDELRDAAERMKFKGYDLGPIAEE